MLDRLLERVARPPGEGLAAGGAVGAEQLYDGAAGPEAGGEEGVAHAERLDGLPGQVTPRVHPGGGAGRGGGVRAICGAGARHGATVTGGEHVWMRNRAPRVVHHD